MTCFYVPALPGGKTENITCTLEDCKTIRIINVPHMYSLQRSKQHISLPNLFGGTTANWMVSLLNTVNCLSQAFLI